MLDPLAPEHHEPLWRAARHPEIWRWTSERVGESRERFLGWLEHALAEAEAGAEVPFATLDARTGDTLGSTRYLALRPEHRSLEIGHTWLTPSAWGTGANVEAKLLLLAHAFEQLGCQRVEFKTDARNERSRRALEALPATFEGVLRKHMLVRDGESRDSAYYSVVDEEWAGVRENLERRLARTLAARRA